MRIVVIGGLAAGPSAAAKAARTNPQADVILFEASETVSYGICETPYVLGGSLPSEEKLVIYTPERLRDEKRIDVRVGHFAERIIPSRKTVVVRDLHAQRSEEVKYDALILATGAHPRRLGIPHEDARNVFCLGSRSDTLAIARYLETETPKQAVIVGGGYVAMETAEAFRARGLAVTLVHRGRLPMPGLEDETREAVRWELERNGVVLIPDAEVEGFVPGKNSAVGHVVTTKGTFEADLVLTAIGVVPNASLAKSAGLRMGAYGGILTNNRQQTSADAIYAAGDCCELVNAVTGERMVLALATLASRTGWIAGENASGGRIKFEGVVRAMGVRVFGLQVAAVGIHSREAASAGIAAESVSIHAYEKIALFPDAQKLNVRLLFERRTGRLLGANLTGPAGAILRAATLSLAIRNGLTVRQLADLDCCYTPPFTPLWDPLLIAAQQAVKKIS